ncbi:MAG: DNA mismatch repair endonuclease MutL [Treponema sp.]|jgi:DNA mismatch repair protein MutL|nr:DNA mismatch repair endonuclease MutL [Treponema sp.]
MTKNKSRIIVLPPEEARRIAAGEVVDRPAALVREFLDNAIDANALNIEISIEEGGCKKVEVSDDGDGMLREDLEICTMTHATSKIRKLDDLDTAVTLGFRGEALSAASAVSRVEILSSTDGRSAWLFETGPGESRPSKIEQTRRTKGTTVRALNLFESVPARKRFLKREASEAALCHQIFIDKALAFSSINFRFVKDGKLKDFFPAVSSKKERFSAALLQTEEIKFLHEINVTGAGFSAEVVIGGAELYRNDRRQLFVFANGRRVQDFSLIQAMEYGVQGWFPNGVHPIGAVFVDIDPSLADFNIHPAKREVRFRDPGAIHHAVSAGVRNFFHGLLAKDISQERRTFGSQSAEAQRKEELFLNISRRDAETAEAQGKEEREFSYSIPDVDRIFKKYDGFSHGNSAPLRLCESSLESLRLSKKSFANDITSAYGNMRYAGRVFGLFILIEWGDKLYIIDQHAAHERILYNRFLEQPIPKQELLAPIPFNTQSDEEDVFLSAKQEELSRMGVDIAKDDGGWSIEALPAGWKMSDAETVKEILELSSAGEDMAKRWAATVCCRAAIKDGDYPDDETAFSLGKTALELPDPRCPHGRPVWTEISRQALFKAVRRE